MKARVHFDSLAVPDSVDWEYVRANTGIYALTTGTIGERENLRFVSLVGDGERCVLFVDKKGFVQEALRCVWDMSRFIPVKTSVTITFNP